MSHKTDFIGDAEGNTWLNSEIEQCSTVFNTSKAEASVEEHFDKVEIPWGVTGIGVNSEYLSGDILGKITITNRASTLLITQSCTKCPLIVKVVTHFWNKLVSSL